MQRKLLCLSILFLIIIKARANPDSTQIQLTPLTFFNNGSTTTIFGIFDPLNAPLGRNGITVVAFSDLYTASNCFSTDFIQNFFGSGFITEEMKDNASEKLTNLNTIGVDFYNGVWLMMAAKKNADNIFLAGIEYNFEESSQFTSDLFHLVFYGNYDYQNITAQLTDSKFSLTSVMEYKVGMMKIFDDDYNTFKIGATGGLVQGLSGLDIKTRYGTLFTAPDGRYLDLEYDFDIHTSGENKPSLTSFIGAGFSFDIFGKAYFQGPEISVNVMMNDIGAVFWNKDPLQYSGDSTLHFEGIEINNLFAATDSAATGNTDSLLEIIGIQKGEKIFSQALPSRLNVSVSKNIGNSMYFTLGTQYIFNTPYKPLIFVQGGKTFYDLKLTVSANAHVGGYGAFNAGLDITKRFGNAIQIKVGSNSLLGLVAQEVFTGVGAYGSLSVMF